MPSVKIATWNLERPAATSVRNQAILGHLQEVDADILILTETNSIINPGTNYKGFATGSLSAGFDGIQYKQGENRVTIWTKFPVTKQHKTYDNYTSVCIDIETPFGSLTVYGTIIGIFGKRQFKTDLDSQLQDFKKISVQGQICIAGDFNTSFCDNYFFTKAGREKLNSFFKERSVTNLTANIPDNIDHIALSNTVIKDCKVQTDIWNTDKILSDHFGVSVTLTS